MNVERTAKDTLTAVELDVGDRLEFSLSNGGSRNILVKSARAEVEARGGGWSGQANGVLRYRMHCTLEVDGVAVELVRTIPSPQNFAAPYELFGLRIWLDAAGDLTQVLADNHGGAGSSVRSFPTRAVRLAVWDAHSRICPTLLHPWFPLPAQGFDVRDCYRGEDTWLGPYRGRESHNGLDINHPAGTRLWTPFAIDAHEMFDDVRLGDNNNRWRGTHVWDNGAAWILQSHHLIQLLVPTDRPIPAGTPYAISAGMAVGVTEHSHFVFRVLDDDTEVLLDPWLLFWQMYEDRLLTTKRSGWGV